MEGKQSHLSFENTEIAFRHKTNAELKKASLLFRSFDYPALLNWGPGLANLTISIGLKSIIKTTIFNQFCGGEDIGECQKTIQHLASSGVGTILDYSVEGAEEEDVFEKTTQEIIDTIKTAKGNDHIPFSVFKVTGIVESELLEKISSQLPLSDEDNIKWNRARDRFFQICEAAYTLDVRVFIDAEESWLQEGIDRLAEEAMERYNKEKVIIYNTLQLYRHDRLAYLKKQVEKNDTMLGFKLVRGAYMEKERARALAHNYNDPIQITKERTDDDYDEAVRYCLENIHKVSLCIGTHNEKSCALAVNILKEKGLEPDDSRVYFSQLLGMSDHISYNLAYHKYKVAKYVPYGPVKAVIPYLTRRAQENSGMSGQMGRELSLITQELQRRKSKK